MAKQILFRPCSVPIPGEDYTVCSLTHTLIYKEARMQRSDLHANLRHLDGNEETVRLSYHIPEILSSKQFPKHSFLLMETGVWAHLVETLLKNKVFLGRAGMYQHPRFEGKKLYAYSISSTLEKKPTTDEVLTFLTQAYPSIPEEGQNQCLSLIERLRMHRGENL